MLYTIENDIISLTVSTYACEMHSLKRKGNDYEYLWNGDATYWKGRNPILFPQIASTSSKINTIKGKKYPMGNHGFARNSEFRFISQNDHKIVFLLEDNNDSLSQYPFKFALYVTYTIEGGTVKLAYEIINKNDTKMPFGFGLHPAFNVMNDYKDSYIVFDDNKRLDLSNELFARNMSFVEEPTPQSAMLYTNKHCIKLSFKDFKHLTIWSPKAPFVCIEPWMNKGVNDDNITFEDRPEYIILNPLDKFDIAYSISLLK